MPQPNIPSEPPTVKPPICDRCGNFMRLAHTQPSEHFTNIDKFQFECDCGQSNISLIAHED